MIKNIVLSNTYRMSSNPNLADNQAAAKDPKNTLLYRMPKRRLQSEMIRDAVLTVSGTLDPKLFGPSVPTHLTSFMTGRGRPSTNGPLDGDGRRSIYLEVRRNFLSPMMLAFDMPSPFSTMGRRNVSNVPAQSLMMMNDPFVLQQASTWAERILAQPGTVKERITNLFENALARPPSDVQLESARQFVKHQARLYEVPEDDIHVWADLCHVLFNMKEFIYLN